MPYPEQEEISYQWLRFRPQMTLAEATLAFKAVFAVTLTGSNFKRAKDRIDEKPPVPDTPKLRYIYALGTLFPLLDVKRVKVKTTMFFGEDTRDDVVKFWFNYAKEFPMDRDEAKALVAESEEKAALKAKGFDLGEDDIEGMEQL